MIFFSYTFSVMAHGADNEHVFARIYLLVRALLVPLVGPPVCFTFASTFLYFCRVSVGSLFRF